MHGRVHHGPSDGVGWQVWSLGESRIYRRVDFYLNLSRAR